MQPSLLTGKLSGFRSHAGRLSGAAFPWQVGLVALTRLACVLLRALLFQRGVGISDLSYHLEMARLSDAGFYPYVHFWMEYPPVIPWLAVAAYRLGAWLAGSGAGALWLHVLISLLVLACDLGTCYVLYRLADLVWGREAAQRSAMIYILAFVPAYLWTGWFDHVPVLLMLSALYLLLRDRPWLSAVLVGCGFMVKVFPILLLPVAVCSLPGLRRKLGYVLVVAVTIALFSLPFLVANPTMFLASWGSVLFRTSWETIWALLDGYFGYGTVAPLSDHFDPAAAMWTNHASTVPRILITALFSPLFAWFFWRLRTVRGRRQIVAAMGFTIVLFLLYSKGYSPQYLTWLAPLLILVLPNARGVVFLLVLGILNLLELPVYFSFFPEQPLLLVATVLLRTGVFIWLAREFLLRCLNPGPTAAELSG